MTGKVILVDQHGNAIGEAGKQAAHQQGQCHRAFSVFIFYTDKGNWKLLLQQRQKNKYHSGGLWTNSCCSHPHPGEETIAAGERRLQEEIGIQVKLIEVGEFHYRAQFDNGLIENEYDHVLIGTVNSPVVNYNKNEVADIHWITIADLLNELKNQPEKFTPWFEQALMIAIENADL